MKDTRFNAIRQRDQYALAVRSQGGDNSRRQRRLRCAVAAAVRSELTEKQRTAVTMYYFGNKSVAEIAKELGVSRSTVYRNMERGMRRIQRAMKYAVEDVEEE